MQYRRLGRTNLSVSVIGLGTWQFGGEWGRNYTPQEVAAIVEAARHEGINLIDTAECYGDHLSEKLIGQAIRELGHKREDWVLATKFGHVFHKAFDRTDAYEAAAVLEQLEGSLRALQTDYIDVYQFHSGSDESFDSQELWAVLDKARQAGKVRHLGVSISSKRGPHQAERATAVGAEVLQVLYNRIDRKVEGDGTLTAAMEQDLGVLARVPLASGFLSGKYAAGVHFPSTDVREVFMKAEQERTLAEVEKVKAEVPAAVPMAQWALAWCLRHPAITAVIPGCKNVEQVRSNAAAAELATSPA